MRFAASSCCRRRWSLADCPKVRSSKPSVREHGWLWRLRDGSKTTSTADFFISTPCASSSSTNRHNAPDRGKKSHVHHSGRFIEDEDAHGVVLKKSAAEVVFEPSRSLYLHRWSFPHASRP